MLGTQREDRGQGSRVSGGEREGMGSRRGSGFDRGGCVVGGGEKKGQAFKNYDSVCVDRFSTDEQTGR